MENSELTMPAAERKPEKLGQYDVVECPLAHGFTPGMYTRKVLVPKGTLAVSHIHKTRHPYVVLKGDISVYIEGQGVTRLQGGHHGITEPGTVRLVYAWEDTEWITFHANPENIKDLEQLQSICVETVEIKEIDEDIIKQLTEEEV